MADFVAVLRKTIEGLKDNSPEMRERVYDKARSTIEAKLAALNPPPPAIVADRQRGALEDAIEVVRAEYDVPPADTYDEDDDFADIFGSDEAYDAPPREAAPIAAAPAGPEWQEEEHDWGRAEPEYADDAAPAPHDDPYREDDPFADPDDDAPLRDADDEDEDELFRSDPYAEPDPSLSAPLRPRKRARRAPTGLIAALLAFVVIAGAVYGIWVNRSDFAGLFGAGSETEVATRPLVEETPVDAADETVEEEQPIDSAAASPGADGEPATPDTQKFTQRLLPDGSEVDQGAAEEEPTIGEGTSVAASSPAAEEGAPASGDQSDEQQLAVGQRAIFYEERTSTSEGSAETGTILWSLVQESPGGDLPPEAAIRAEVTIPERDLQLRMTIRRNGDQSLPASHIIEMIFLTPDNFPGGTIDNVLRVTMKDTEQATGSPLIGIPAKIADGFFLVALSDSSAEVEANLTLMRRQNWIDIPIVYGSGQRALMTMEKGVPGDRVFQEAIRAWTAEPEEPAQGQPAAQDGETPPAPLTPDQVQD